MKRIVATSLVLLALAGCSAPSPATRAQTAQPQTVTVFAAASLKGAFGQIKTQFESEHPGASVTYNFNGSSSLVDQMKGGAPADVFASADEANMTKAVDAQLVTGQPTLFASNVLTLAVAPGNPKHITGLDASLAGKKLVVCASGVPCGNALDTLVRRRGVAIAPVSREQSVTDVLGKVTSGEADAGVVYATDTAAAGAKATAVPIAGADQVVNRYPIAVTATSKQADLARAYVAYVAGEKGQSVLGRYGFGKP